MTHYRIHLNYSNRNAKTTINHQTWNMNFVETINLFKYGQNNVMNAEWDVNEF